MTALEVTTTGALVPIGAPILPGGIESHIRKMTFGRFYVSDVPGYGLAACSPDFLDWITGKAQPEDRVELCKLRCDEGVYRLRTDGDVTRPVAVWVEQYLNARYLSSESKRTVARRTLFVLMPVKFPSGR